jgi:hypothetical protein
VHVRQKLRSLLRNVLTSSNREVKDKAGVRMDEILTTYVTRMVINSSRENYKTRDLGSVIYFTYFSCLGLINLHCGIGLPVGMVASFLLMKIRFIPMDDFC